MKKINHLNESYIISPLTEKKQRHPYVGIKLHDVFLSHFHTISIFTVLWEPKRPQIQITESQDCWKDSLRTEFLIAIISLMLLLPLESWLSFGRLHARRFGVLPIWLYKPSSVCLQPTVPQKPMTQHQCCKKKNKIQYNCPWLFGRQLNGIHNLFGRLYMTVW